MLMQHAASVEVWAARFVQHHHGCCSVLSILFTVCLHPFSLQARPCQVTIPGTPSTQMYPLWPSRHHPAPDQPLFLSQACSPRSHSYSFFFWKKLNFLQGSAHPYACFPSPGHPGGHRPANIRPRAAAPHAHSPCVPHMGPGDWVAAPHPGGKQLGTGQPRCGSPAAGLLAQRRGWWASPSTSSRCYFCLLLARLRRKRCYCRRVGGVGALLCVRRCGSPGLTLPSPFLSPRHFYVCL